MTNNEIAKTLEEISELLEIKGISFKPAAYKKAAKAIKELDFDIKEKYEEDGIKSIRKIKGVGESIAKKTEEYIKKGKIKYLEELRQETAIRQIITHFFKRKGLSLNEIKQSAKKKKIIYSRFTKPAKQLLELSGSVEKAKSAIDKIADWANSRKLDYAIETTFKKWLELDRLKPKEIIKKPFFRNNPMIWSQTKKKWYVIDGSGQWLEFAGKDSEIEWKIEQ